MNVIKLILIIAAVLGVLAVCVTPAAAETKTWDRGHGSNSWHDGDNWEPNGEPQAADDVIIPIISGGYLVVISSDDAACKTLDIALKSVLEITGKTLTLGANGTTTTSNLDWGGEFADGTIRFVKSGSDPGILRVHQTVIFIGGGTIEALTSNDAGRIERASGTDGIVISAAGVGQMAANAVFGNITLLCNVSNEGDRFGTNLSSQTMVFGSSNGPADPAPEPTISGAGVFESDGKIQFRIVSFGEMAPKWFVRLGEIEVTDEADDEHWVDVPFDIDMNNDGGLLDLHHDFSCTGTLTVSVGNNTTQTITVRNGKIAEFKPEGG